MTSLRFHICETEHGWVGLIFSEHGLRETTLPLPSRDEALGRVLEAGASEPAPEREVADVPERLCALARLILPFVNERDRFVSDFRLC